MYSGFLIYMLFLPVLTAVLILFEKSERVCRILALMVTGAELVISIVLYWVLLKGYAGPGRWFLAIDLPWVDRYGMRFSLGMDGISLLLVNLTALLFLLSVIVSWRSVKTKVPLFHAMLLVLETGVLGVFLVDRPFPVLPLLGGNADTHVLPDRRLGTRQAHILGGQVPDIHGYRKPLHAPLDHRSLCYPREPDWRLHLRA